MVEKLIILGSGPAGLTAAIYAGRANIQPIVIEGRQPGGQLTSTSCVENWPGEISILGTDLMKKMRIHASHYGARLMSAEAQSINLLQRPFVLSTAHMTLETHTLIIATGAAPRTLNCPGEDVYWGRGITTCAVCDGAFYKNKPVVVIGGGDSAMETASFLLNFTDCITIIQILPHLTASHIMQQRVLNHPCIHIIYNSSVVSINGDDTRVQSVTIRNNQSNTVEDIPASGVFLAIGLSPSTAIFKNQLELTDYGYIVLKEHTQTSVPGVFAAGDVADNRYRQAITSAGSGCAALLDAERYLKEQNLF